MGAPVAAQLLSPSESLQRLAATPIYWLFAVVQVILLACAAGAYRRRQWVAKVLLGCAVAWTATIPAWVALSPVGLVSLLMSLGPSGIARFSS